MATKFKGHERNYEVDNIEFKVRIHKDANDKIEKIVIVDNKRRCTLTLAELSVAFQVAEDLNLFTKNSMNESELCTLIRDKIIPNIVVDKISAMKAYRALTHTDLKESADAIEILGSHGFDYWCANVWTPYRIAKPWVLEPTYFERAKSNFLSIRL